MIRLPTLILAALAVGLTPVLAADTSAPSDTSSGAAEQSSSTPSTQSKMGKMGEKRVSPPSAPSTSSKMGTPNPAAPSSGD